MGPRTFLSAAAASAACLALLPDASAAPIQDSAWTFAYRPTVLEDLAPYEIKSFPDGSIVVLGQAEVAVGLPQHVLVKLDENGDRLWERAFAFVPTQPFTVSPVYHAAAIDLDAAGNIYLATSGFSTFGDGIVRKLAPDGTTLWQRLIRKGGSYTLQQLTDVDASDPGQVVLTGLLVSNGGLDINSRRTTALNANTGEIEWPIGDPVASIDGVATLVKRGPNRQIFVGGQTDAPNRPHSPRVSVRRPNGTFRWSADLPPISAAMPHRVDDMLVDLLGTVTVISNPGSLPGARRLRLSQFNGTGGLEFDTTWSPSGSERAFGRKLVELSNGDFWVAGAKAATSTAPYLPRIFRFNSAGVFMGELIPPGASGTTEGSVESLLALPGGGALALGSVEGGGIAQSFLLRIDASGAVIQSSALRGNVPEGPDAAFGGSSLVFGARGNVFSLTQTTVGASDDQLIVNKLIEGGSVGTSFCSPGVPNSTGVAAKIQALGSDGAGIANVTLLATDVPSGSSTLFLASLTQGFAPGVGGGQGTLCLGGAIGRYVGPGQLRRAGSDLSASLQLHLDEVPQPTGLVQAIAGETWNFQAWFRDANPTVTSNLTDGVAVTLQ